jgi:four helix bundle protein
LHLTITEGAERQTRPEFRQFLHIAKGSVAELRTQLIIAERAGIIPSEQVNKLSQELIEIARMLQGLIKSI